MSYDQLDFLKLQIRKKGVEIGREVANLDPPVLQIRIAEQNFVPLISNSKVENPPILLFFIEIRKGLKMVAQSLLDHPE